MAQQKNSGTIFGLSTSEALVVGVGAVAGVLVVKSIIDKTGNLLGSNDSANNNAGITGKAWDPNFYKTAPGGTLILSASDALALAQKIHSYSGLFFDSPGVVFDALKSARSKADVSRIAEAFSGYYNYDLYQYLLDGGGFLPADGLSNTNLSKVNAYVNGLPNF